MKITGGIAAAVFFFFALFSGQAMPHEEKMRHVDLFDLISFFLLGEGDAEDTFPDWFSGAEEDSPVEWITEGLSTDKESQLFMREGEAVVTLDGNPIYVLKKKKEPARWSVKIIGPRTGIDSVEISSVVNSQDIQLEFDDALKKRNIQYKLVRCDLAGMASFGERVYAVKFPKMRPCWIAHAWSCGSSGCSADLKIFGMNSREESLYALFR